MVRKDGKNPRRPRLKTKADLKKENPSQVPETDGRELKKYVFTPDQVYQVETLSAVLSVAQMADYFGIDESTFHEIRNRQPEVAQAYKRGKARAIGAVARGLLQQALSGNRTASIFYLKTQAGWRETNRVEHTGPDGKPIVMHQNQSVEINLDLSELDMDELKLLKSIGMKLKGKESDAAISD